MTKLKTEETWKNYSLGIVDTTSPIWSRSANNHRIIEIGQRPITQKGKKWVSVKWEKLTEDCGLSGIVEAENDDLSFFVSDDGQEHFHKQYTHLERFTLSAWNLEIFLRSQAEPWS
jgi:hypothetical protein